MRGRCGILALVVIGALLAAPVALAAGGGHGHGHHHHRGPRGPQGPVGEQGAPGQPGATGVASITIHYVTGSSVSVPLNQQGTATATCPAGTSVTGGGGFGGGGVGTHQVSASFPFDGGDPDTVPDDGWKVLSNNIQGGPWNLTPYAICISAASTRATPPPGGRVVHRGRHRGHRGPRGPQGPVGPAGADGAPGAPPAVNLSYVESDTNSYSTGGFGFPSASCAPTAHVTGVGIEATPGSRLALHAVSPSNSSGNEAYDDGLYGDFTVLSPTATVTGWVVCIDDVQTSPFTQARQVMRGGGHHHHHHRGPRGPQGPQGPAGPAGVAGGTTPIALVYAQPQGGTAAKGAQTLRTTDCPAGTSVLGGGFFTDGSDTAANGTYPRDSGDADTLPDDGWGTYMDNMQLVSDPDPAPHFRNVVVCVQAAAVQAN